jgi:DNA gyrase/topoisomerase IV subunit A
MIGGSALLVITEDGYGKRVPITDIPRTRRGAGGVHLSSVPVAATLMVRGGEHVMIATATGKLERVAADQVPMRRRRVRSGGTLAKGARLVRLVNGDRVTTAALTPPQV